MTNSFNIINGENYTLDDVRMHQKDGGSVLRSAHIGNFDIVTLFLAQQGFPVLLHEHLRGNSKIYEPAYIKLESKLFPLVLKPELPLMHLIITDKHASGVKIAKKIIKNFQNPAHFHYLSLLRLFPENIQLVSELFMEQKDFFEKALSILAEKFPLLFTRYIGEDGTEFLLFKKQKKSDDNQIYESSLGGRVVIEKKQIAKLTFAYLQDTIRVLHGEKNKPKGIVMSVPLYVLLTTLCEIYKERNGVPRYKKDSVTVMHFSGAAMIDYLILKKTEALYNSRKIEEMYQVLLKEMPDVLPTRIDFILVPTRVFRNFILESKKELRNLCRLFLNYKPITERTRGLNKRQLKEYFERVRKIICKDIKSINTPREISQYDMLLKEYKIFVPNFIFNKSHKYLRRMRNTLIRECANNTSQYGLKNKDKNGPIYVVSMDLSYCVDENDSEEKNFDEIREVFDNKSLFLDKIKILQRTKYKDLPMVAIHRLGAKEGQDNILVRITLKNNNSKVLSKEEVANLYNIAYTKLHKGTTEGYGLNRQ